MRIVQTFWTAGQDPLKHTFGWLHPEYNLMSWALSCLSLREHYDEVALYTDFETSGSFKLTKGVTVERGAKLKIMPSDIKF